MNANEKNFQVGQVVKVVSGRYGNYHVTLARVAKVWKNGVVEIGTLEGDGHGGRTFNPDGYERGRNNCTRIQALVDGETVESFQAAQKAAADKAKAEQDRKDAERAAAVQAWWAESGKAMWDARVTLPGDFMGKTVQVIRYQRYDEQYMPFVVLGEEKDFTGRTDITAEVGGLVGRQYKGFQDKEVTSISNYSSSTVRGTTLEGVLYQVTH